MSVDGQNIAYGKPEDALHARFTQSIAVTRDFGAPKPSGTQLGMTGVIFEDVMTKAKSDKRPLTDRATNRKALRMQHRIERNEYTTRVGSMPLPSESEPNSNAHRGNPEAAPSFLRPESSAVFKQMLKYNPLQAQVIETLWTADNASLGECVKPLMALASPQPFRPLYPDPILPPQKNGSCPYCHTDIFNRKLWGHGRRAMHLLECHQNKHSVTFCLQCAMFVGNRLFRGHMCQDLDLERSGIYGVIVWRKLVIAEGRCPYGVSRVCRRRRFRDPQRLKSHIEGVHIRKQSEGDQKCPAEGCDIVAPSKEGLRVHLQGTHYVRMWNSTTTISSQLAQSDEV
jgi:hypothetical protein